MYVHSRSSSEPLPVERSQGSVSALVARFQTAADRDKESASRRASLQPSNGGSRRTSATSPGVTPKLDEGNSTLANPDSGLDEAPNGKMSNDPDGGKRVQDKTNGEGRAGEVEEMLHKASEGLKDIETKVSNALSTSTPKKRPNEITADSANKPVVPPKSPKRMSSTGVMSPIVPSSPTVGQIAGPSIDYGDKTQTEGVNSNLVGSNTLTKTKTPSKTVSKPAPSSNTPQDKKISLTTPKTMFTSATQAKSSGAKTSFPSPATTNGKTSSTTPNTVKTDAAPRSRLSSTTSSSTTPRTRPSASATTHTPTSATQKRTPSANIDFTSTTTATKPLTPNLTGPARLRQPRPSSFLSPSTSTHPPSPLKPHLTGTPSKPTASSLAKARSPPDHHPSSSEKEKQPTASRQNLSMGRTGGVKGSSSVRRLVSASPSPSPTASGPGADKDKTEASDTPTKRSSTSSRLLQGTAASRARATAAASTSTPSSSSHDTNVKKSFTPRGSTSTTTPKSTTPINTPASQSRAIQTSKSNSSTPLSTKVQTPTSTTQSKPRANGKTPTTSSKKEAARMPPVGRSPIGRLGLAAAGMKKLPGSSVADAKVKEQDVERGGSEANPTAHDKIENLQENGSSKRDEMSQEANEPNGEDGKRELMEITQNRPDDSDIAEEIRSPILRPATPSPPPPPPSAPAGGEIESKAIGLAKEEHGEVVESMKIEEGGEEADGLELEEIPDIE
ncbi:hypothetical protein IAR55_006035 [Kwoniella newhampshirensis]|uniref:Uncharacterized protein n=1 Tax=Kwoniella newhampshirensis TaxID=1651941 RepID=A0AAW0YUG2_9TREE